MIFNDSSSPIWSFSVELPTTPLALVNSSNLSNLQGKLQALPAPAKERLASINQQQQATGTGLSVTVPSQEDEEGRAGSLKAAPGEVTHHLEAGKEGGLGPRWPKGMWDVMDSKYYYGGPRNSLNLVTLGS